MYKTNKWLGIASAGLVAFLAGCGGNDYDASINITNAVMCTNTGMKDQEDFCKSDYHGDYTYLWGLSQSEPDVKPSLRFVDGKPAPETDMVRLTRWSPEPNHGVDGGSLIPVYFQETQDSRFTYALDKVEEIIGYTLFDRRGVINLTIKGNNVDYGNLSGFGFIFSQGTASPEGEANVSRYPNHGAPTFHLVDDNYMIVASGNLDESDSETAFTWINLDSVSGSASNMHAVHELAHALGMIRHFPGFGDEEGIFNSNAEAVLKTMYSSSNPPGQPFDSLFVK